MKYVDFLIASPDCVLLTHCVNGCYKKDEINVNSILKEGILSQATLYDGELECGAKIEAGNRYHYIFAGIPKSLQPQDIIDSLFCKKVQQRNSNSRWKEIANFVIFYEEKDSICCDYREGGKNNPFERKRKTTTIEKFQMEKQWAYSEFISPNIPSEKILAFTKAKRYSPKYAIDSYSTIDKITVTQMIESTFQHYLFFPLEQGNNVLIDYDTKSKKYILRVILEKDAVFGKPEVEKKIQTFLDNFEIDSFIKDPSLIKSKEYNLKNPIHNYQFLDIKAIIQIVQIMWNDYLFIPTDKNDNVSFYWSADLQYTLKIIFARNKAEKPEIAEEIQTFLDNLDINDFVKERYVEPVTTTKAVQCTADPNQLSSTAMEWN